MRPGLSQGAMILAAYMIPYGAMQLVHGHFSEAYGRIRLLRLWLMLGVAFGTIGCALSPSFVWGAYFSWSDRLFCGRTDRHCPWR